MGTEKGNWFCFLIFPICPSGLPLFMHQVVTIRRDIICFIGVGVGFWRGKSRHKNQVSHCLYSIPEGGFTSTAFSPTSLQLVLKTVPPDS